MTKNSYDTFLNNLQLSLQQKDFEKLDEALQLLHSGWLTQKEIDSLDEIISEATLYLELKEEEYREMALVLIWELEEN